VSPMRPFRAGTATCRCGIPSASSIVMSSSPICLRGVGARLFRHGAWHWSRSCNLLQGLPDRQAADAVRARIDWKYALGLELTDAGFDYSVLSEFRARLVAGSAEGRLLDVLVEACTQQGYLKVELPRFGGR
jgi:hypothetical protein